MTARTVDPIYIPLTVLCPHGTLPAVPLVTAANVEPGMLEAIDLQIPPGHSGVTGIRFALSGQQFLPWSTPVAWIIDDGLRETFDINIQVDKLLTVITYNTGNFDHSFSMRFRIRRLSANTAPAPLRLVSNNELSA